jgi:L-lactate dehydrogenase complex protein LldF
MKRPPVEQFAREIKPDTVDSVRAASASKTSARVTTLTDVFVDPEQARSDAAAVKSHVLDHLHGYLLQLEERCFANGIKVHWAKDAASANEIILRICRQAAPKGGVVVKAKSMATEEIHLNAYLEGGGFEPVETDLGEYVVQIDHDVPSHIVTPIIHKNRKQIAASFEREGLGPYTEDPGALAMQARERLREKFRQAAIGISGVNFAIAETGRIVLVENEGNNRLSTTAPQVHIAVMGIEKVLPREQDLPLFLKLLAGSATGQRVTSYVHLISGPRRSDESDGPSEVHLVLLDNGRTDVLAGPYRDILRCIRCGACLNVCPVYRQASGHAYGHVYSGPLGAVLAPALEGVEKRGDLAKASSLCGACEEVCPVKIPIPSMLLKLRDEAYRKKAVEDAAPWDLYARGATHPGQWRLGLKLLPLAGPIPHPMKAGWSEFHQLPAREGRSFRRWWRDRS